MRYTPPAKNTAQAQAGLMPRQSPRDARRHYALMAALFSALLMAILLLRPGAALAEEEFLDPEVAFVL